MARRDGCRRNRVAPRFPTPVAAWQCSPGFIFFPMFPCVLVAREWLEREFPCHADVTL